MFQRLKTPQLPQTRTAICDIIMSLAQFELEHQNWLTFGKLEATVPGNRRNKARKEPFLTQQFHLTNSQNEKLWLLSSFSLLVTHDLCQESSELCGLPAPSYISIPI